MIARISAEGQYRLDSDLLDQINALDNRLVEVVAADDESAFCDIFEKMLALVRQGQPLPPDELHPSDVILPPSDLSLEEAREIFTGHGVIPG
ncbi:MAG: hypothetical protein HY331_13085 [Chloroflexi bacterium]|nr:hypothetical protein [Chloroflexota bacterium]